MRQKIEIEDRGQDFWNFEVGDDGKIQNANMQGWMWNGRQLDRSTFPLAVGDAVVFEDGRRLNYRIVAIEDAVEPSEQA